MHLINAEEATYHTAIHIRLQILPCFCNYEMPPRLQRCVFCALAPPHSHTKALLTCIST
jgi:hypothetical protein